MNLRIFNTVLVLIALQHVAYSQNPKADPKAIIVSDEARFTLLSPETVHKKFGM